jgi:exopolysaccharide production protein ExoZ
MAVVAYHALLRTGGGFDVGRAGVDVFFVISGVIMWRVAQGRDPAPDAFLWRRLTRVAPLYWLATLAVLAATLAWPRFLPEVRPGWGHLALSLLFVPHLDPKGLPFPTLPPGWSLDYEAAFYLSFAAALVGPRAWRGRLVLAALAGLTALGVAIPALYYLGANPMLLQFAAGVLLGIAAEHDLLPARWTGAAMLAAALIGWIAVETSGVFSELWRPLLWGVPATLTVAGALILELRGPRRPAPTPIGRTVRVLGDASYAIYILHLPAVAAVALILGWRNLGLFLAAAMAASLAAGLAGRAWIEKPLMGALRRPETSPLAPIRAI